MTRATATKNTKTFVSTMILATVTMLTQAREFPVQVKLEDWDYEEEKDVETYIQDLIKESGVAGIGIGFVVSLCMFFGIILFWCCPCCGFDRCCLCCEKKEKKRWSEKANRKCGTTMLVISLLICGAGVGLLYPTTVDTIEKGDSAMSNAQGAVVDAMNYVCGDPLTTYLVENGADSYDSYAAGKTVSEMCAASTSVSAYLTDTSCKINSTLDGVNDFIDGLSDIVAALDAITTAIGGMESAVNNLETAATDVNTTCGNDLDASITSVNDYTGSFTDANGNNVPVLSNIPVVGFTVDASIMSDIDAAQIDIAAAKTDAQTSANDARTTIETDLQVTTKTELEDAMSSATEELNDAQIELLDIMPDAAEVRENIRDAQTDYYNEYSDYALIGFLVFYGLGFIFVAISLCGMLRMSTCCVQCGGCFIFLVTFWLCTFMGLTVLLWYITGDVCDNMWEGNAKSGYRGLFQVNLANETFDIQNITINVADVVESVLKCQSGCEDIVSSCGSLPRMNETNTGCDSTNNLLDILGIQDEFNFTKDIQPSIDEILNYAPDLNYSVEIQSARTQLNTPSVNESLNYDFNFNLTDVYSIAPIVLANLPICESSCSDATVSNECTKWQSIWSIDSLDCICAVLTSNTNFDSSTNYYDANCVYVSRVLAINASANSCAETSDNITFAQAAIGTALDVVDTALSSADTTILEKQAELIEQADELGVLVAYIPEEAPGHLTCEWISNAWSTTIEGDVCTHAYESMQNAFPGMALCIGGMVLAFFSMLNCANPNRIREEGGKDAGVTPQSHWEHPLAHPDGAVDENGRVRIPETPKKYWNAELSPAGDKEKAGVDGPMFPDGVDNSTTVSSAVASSEPTAQVVAISSSSSNLYGL